MSRSYLSNKKIAKKNKMLAERRKEIEKLEFDLKHSKAKNLKISLLKNLKISLRVGQLIAPYVLSSFILTEVFSIFGATPFFRDDREKKLQIKTEIDSFNNVRYEQTYDDLSGCCGTISYVGKWEKQPDGSYLRNVKVYSTEEMDENIIKNIVLENNNDKNNLNEILGEPKFSKIQVQNNLTEEEIKEEPYLEGVIYSKADDDFIVVKESVEENILSTILYCAILAFTELLTVLGRDAFSSFDFHDCVEEIKKKYKSVDVDDLAKRLEIRRSSYNRLTR